MHKQISPKQWGTAHTKLGMIVYMQIVNKYNSQSMYPSIHPSIYPSVYPSIHVSIFYLSISVLKICPAYKFANFSNCVNWSYELTNMVPLNLCSNKLSLPTTERMDWGWDTFSFFQCTFSFLQDKRQFQIYFKFSFEH